MRIHLIRHTTPDIKKGLCYGQTDLDVTDTFEQEKEHVLSKLLGEYDAVFTSPLQRCSKFCLLYTSPSPRDLSTSRMPSSA